MRRLVVLIALASTVAVAKQPRHHPEALQTADLILQTSRSSQSAAIRLATHSVYSHVGLIEVAKDGVYVIEAIGPVSRTPLEKWKQRGLGQRWTVLRDPTLTGAQRDAILAEAKAQLGKPYDFKFGWDDEALYCSELVRKAYARGAGRSIGRMQKLTDLDLEPIGPALKARYGEVPTELELVTPASLAEDAALITIKTTFPQKIAQARRP